MIEMICSIAKNAGLAAMQHYQCQTTVSYKSDRSPVTAADLAAEGIIVPALQQLTPHIPIISEESAPLSTTDTAPEHFWLVDPIDGTKEFLSGNGEFTVNIALIKHGIPVLGVVYAPALDMLYYGQTGDSAWCEQQGNKKIISCRSQPPDGLVVVASRSHNDASSLEQFLLGTHVRQYVSVGSSLKFCHVASGQADLYPRLGRTMEWDTAAGHAVLLAAGGSIACQNDGTPLRYGKPGFENPHFVARGKTA